jgi:ribulose-phosphate 3-epimerase
MDYLIFPSILSADLTCLGEEVEAVMQAGADYIHFDVMDNHYVPNLTFGPILCEKLHQRFPDVPLDVHLMVQPVDSLIEAFAKAGATRISIHPEASLHVDRSLSLIKDMGCQAGLVLNPATPIACLEWVHHLLDFVLLMTVNPGFGGQKLIAPLLKKISTAHGLYPHLPLCVDGGINSDNIRQLAAAGACQFVAGSAIFGQKDYKLAIETMRHNLI